MNRSHKNQPHYLVEVDESYYAFLRQFILSNWKRSHLLSYYSVKPRSMTE